MACKLEMLVELKIKGVGYLRYHDEVICSGKSYSQRGAHKCVFDGNNALCHLSMNGQIFREPLTANLREATLLHLPYLSSTLVCGRVP